MTNPSRGEVWLINLDPTVGREQAGRRPALVVSGDKLNHGPAELLIIAPLTTKDKGIVTHIRVEPESGGVREPSFVMTEAFRSVSKQRLIKLLGTVDSKVLAEVEYSISAVLGLMNVG